MRRRLAIVTVVTTLLTLSGGGALLYKEVVTMPPLVDPPRDRFYATLTRKYLNGNQLFDREGIPLDVVGGRQHYHPVQISQFALGAHEHYIDTADATARASFLKIARWLSQSLVKRGNYSYWEYTVENPSHPGGLGVPWVSAMAQGQGASVLVRAFRDTGDETYLRKAREAITPIFYDLSVGGVSVVRGSDYIFPQEYPSDPPSNILNGAVAAFWGVRDYAQVSGDPEARRISDIIVRTFAGALETYDTGYWSLYCHWPYLAKPHYQRVHVSQLRALHRMTGDDLFLKYANRFEAYYNRPLNRARYVLETYVRQGRELTLEDVPKIPGHVFDILRK